MKENWTRSHATAMNVAIRHYSHVPVASEKKVIASVAERYERIREQGERIAERDIRADAAAKDLVRQKERKEARVLQLLRYRRAPPTIPVNRTQAATADGLKCRRRSSGNSMSASARLRVSCHLYA